MANADWRDRANRLLDAIERGDRRGRFSKTSIAKEVGVSRQTLWRDGAISGRVAVLQLHKLSRRGDGAPRSSLEGRVKQLEAQVAQLQKENGLLVQNFLYACRQMHEHGLDPVSLIGASDPDALRSTHLERH